MSNKHLVYGRGKEEGIVATETLYGQENKIQVYYRDGDKLTSYYKTYKPFIYISSNDPIREQFYKNTPEKKLLGSNPLDIRVEHDNYSFIKYVEKNADHSYCPFLQSQWMIQSGQTQFKGMDFDDPLRLYVDIEVYTPPKYEFPNSSRDSDKIIIISMLDNRGNEWVLALDEDDMSFGDAHFYSSEEELLIHFVKWIRKIDPDVLIGHNCFTPDSEVKLYDGRTVSMKEMVENNQISKISNVKHKGRYIDEPSFDLTVNKNKRKYKGRIITLIGNYDTELKTTPEHTHYSYKDGEIGYHTAEELSKGDMLAQPTKHASPNYFNKYNEEDFYFAGLMITDGHCEYDTNSMYFSNTNKKLIKWIKKYLTNKDVTFNTHSNKKKKEYHKKVLRVTWSSKHLKRMLFDLGVVSGNKSIKDRSVDLSNIYATKENKVVSFISGVIDGDGSIVKNYILIASNPESHKKWFVSLCKKLGFLSYKTGNGIRIIPTINNHKTFQRIFNKCLSSKVNTKKLNYYGDRLPKDIIDYIKPFFRGQQGYKREYYTQDGKEIYTGLGYSDVNLPKTTVNYIINKKTSLSRKNLYKFKEAIRDNLDKFSNKKQKNWKRANKKLEQIEQYYWLKIREKKIQEYNGYVYNFGTNNRNYIISNCLTHNCFGFDLPYIRDRCELLDVPLKLGRDGSEPYTFHTSIKFAEKSDEYENFSIHGRHVLDTYFLAKKYDMVARDLPGYGLKQCVKYLGKESRDRTYIEGDEISLVWDGDHPDYSRQNLIDYALDDVRETRVLDKEWGQTVFQTTKMFPLPMQDVFRYGTGNKIDLLFAREYYYMDWSVPFPQQKQEYSGGYADTFYVGAVKEPLVYVDVSSLYPSLAKKLNIQPKSDELKMFQRLIRLVWDERFKYKNAANKAEGEEKTRLEGIDGALKILLNTASYGYLGYQWGNWNDYEEAERITTAGRKMIKQINSIAEDLGSFVYKTDTDGSLCKIPEDFIARIKNGKRGEANKFIQSIEDELGEEGIELDNDGEYQGAIMFDDKSYVLLDYDGDYTIKGNTLTGRTIEGYNRQFIREVLDCIFDGKWEGIREAYDKICEKIEGYDLEPGEIQRRSTLNMSLEEYKNKIKSGQNPITQYHLALNSNKPLQKGDVIKYYISEPPLIKKEYKTVEDKWVRERLSNYEKAKLIEDYDYDFDRDYYKKRLNDTVRKFLVVLGKARFKILFPELNLRKPDRQKLEKAKELVQ